jgi:predicted Zn-dependent peptidase
MANPNIDRQVSANGLNVVTIDLPEFHSVTNFLVIRSGSRYETASNSGIAHFLEHMVFKGTKKYPDTKAVAEAVEGLGGMFNAWTSNDHTAYYNTVPERHWRQGIEFATELAFEALLRPEDLDRERGVIIEEIRRIQDNPARYVDDLLGQILFAGNPLGQLIIGTQDSITNMKIGQFEEYRQTHYLPSQATFVAVGKITGRDILGEVEVKTRHLQASTVTLPKRFDNPSKKALKVHQKDTDQTHFMLGLAEPTLALNRQEQYIGDVLNTILGSGMSSRLFLNIREKQGLAYAIAPSTQSFEDTGALAIYGGVNTQKVEKALIAVDLELKKLKGEVVSEVELTKAKNIITGSLDLNADDPIKMATWYGTGMLLGLKEDFAKAKELVNQVSAQDVQLLAQKIFNKDRLALAVIGPFDSEKMFEDFLGNNGS